MAHLAARSLRLSARGPPCRHRLLPQARQFHITPPIHQSNPQQPAKPTTKPPPPKTAAVKPPPPKNIIKNPDDLSRGDTFTPNPLPRPIGYPYPPTPIDNLPHDLRSRAQKRADFKNYDKHLEKRQKMIREIARPYFRDFTNMQYAQGKIFVANMRLWKREVSLWWPNLWGWDVKRKGVEACTVDVFRGVVNVVCVFSRTWAERQTETFVDEKVQQLIAENGDVAQLVEINVEEQKLSRTILWAFAGGLRRRKKEDWRHYLVSKSVPTEVREVLGMLNHKAGYVFLVDSAGKIRWAGSGDATGGEKEWLMNGLGKLIQQEREDRASKGRNSGEAVAKPAMAAADG